MSKNYYQMLKDGILVDGSGGGSGTPDTDLMGYTWEQGASDDEGNFIPGSATARILCQTYFEIPVNAEALRVSGVANESPLLFIADFYREDKSFISETNWAAGNAAIPQQAKYVRFVLRYENGSTTIQPSQLSCCDLLITMA